MNAVAAASPVRRLEGLPAQLAVVSTTVFFSSLAFDLYNGTLPIYLFRDRGFGLSLVSLLIGVASVTQLVGALAAGQFIDRRGARLTLRLGPALQLPAALIFAFSHDPALLALARVLQATGFVLVLPAAYSVLPGMVSLRRRGTALGVVGVANTTALALGSPLGLWLLDRSPYALFGASATAGLLALASGSLLLVGDPVARAAGALVVRGAWLPFLAGSFLAFINWGVLLAFLPLQLPAARLADVGWFFAADAIALTLLRIPLGYASDRWGGRLTALAGVACNLAALAVLLQSRSLAALVIAGFGTGAAAALLLPAIQLELSFRCLESERGTAMALAGASFAFAVSLGTLLGGPIVAGAGFQTALWLSAAACALAVVPLLLAPAAPHERAPAPGAVLEGLVSMSPLEAQIAAVWQEVLGVEQVGLGQGFLELGGESLQAIQIATHLSEALDLELPLVHVFEHPSVVESALAIEALLEAPDHSPAPHLLPTGDAREAPASFAQERMWFLDQLDPGSAAYNVPFALRFRGRLDLPALERSLGRLLLRQESLRTRLETSAGDVLQVVAPPAPFWLELTDLSRGAPEEKERALIQALEAEARRPFELVQGPLCRAQLYRLGAQDHVLMLTCHHSVCDEWSRRVLVGELAAGYRAEAGSPLPEPAPAPEPGISYRDFTFWQRKSLAGDRERELLEFWLDELVGAPAGVSLPTDRSRPPQRTYRGDLFLLTLPPALAEAVHELSLRRQVTPFMTLLAVFATLLQRHTGQEDLLVGSPVVNRALPETEELVGCFVNTLVLRIRLDGDPSFEELLDRVRHTCLGAYAHSELPFERLVDQLHADRGMSRTPLFQVMFDLEHPPPAEGFPADLEVEAISVGTGTSMFDLSLSVSERDQGLRAAFEYSTDLFEAASIERLAAHFRRLLEAALAAPQNRLSELDMLPELERGRLLELSSGAFAPPGPAVHRRVEEHARLRAQIPAVVYEGRELTYLELNARSNQLARHLAARGARPGVLVGLCLERTPEFVIAALAAHKAGAGYVPLDPAYPAARLARLLEDAEPVLVVTESRLLERLPARPGTLVVLDHEQGSIGSREVSDLEPGPDLAHPAYVIHTSGSTGRPKGVVVSQGALASWVDAAGRAYGLGSDDRVLQFHSIGFDASVGDVFCTLGAGATLVIGPDPVRISPAALLQALPRLRPTVADLPTAYWHELVDELEGRPALPVGLRLVIIGGESALPEKMRLWQRRVDPRIRLANSYGPTESTVVATLWWLTAGFADREPASVPIGRPVDNVRAYVLDPSLKPCPVGVRGELYLGGAQLAVGYLNLPEETASRFVAGDPFASGRPERLYRTGDVARWLPEGNLEFLGRADRQVKIRGFRIEPGELETALAAHPAVAAVAVEARERLAGEIQLVAYLVPRPDHQPGAADLRRYLEARLPSQALPAAFVFLERLPLSSSGKVDRAALPAPLPARPAARVAVAPTPLEAALSRAWAEVLQVESVGLHDNFFDLGGHSLLAARLVGRLRRELETELPLRAVFESPTVADLASQILASQGRGSGRQALEQR